MKNIDALKTIGEVSKTINVPQHVIRFWEKKIDKIKPIQKTNGRRYYSKGDVEILEKIKNLLYDYHYTIKGVQKYFNLRDKESKNNSDELIEELKFLSSEIKKKL
ncbi:MAG: transcriptional regulator [Rickettsiales bacterium]|nr:transcriptional regulator [Rickettsiales bacterium]|tara:strand:+ start:49939 stop:50253 length:315 start_codon:yes stop_codon:yes gene_type:complete